MTPQAALIELVARIGAQGGASVYLTTEELRQWPAVAVAALKAQMLLVKARLATRRERRPLRESSLRDRSRHLCKNITPRTSG